MTEQEWLASTDPVVMLRLCIGQESLEPPMGGATLFRTSDRKLRLFACACQEAFLPDRPEPYVYTKERDGSDDDFTRHMLGLDEVVRLWVDLGMASGNPLLPARNYAGDAPRKASLLRDIIGNQFRPVAMLPGPQVRRKCGCGRGRHKNRPQSHNVCAACNGEGFVSEPGPCPWLTGTVLALARAAYEDRQPDGTIDPAHLMILADALEEAGCIPEVTCPTCSGKGWHYLSSAAGDSRWQWCEKCNEDNRVYNPLLAHLRAPGPHVRGCWALDAILGKE